MGLFSFIGRLFGKKKTQGDDQVDEVRPRRVVERKLLTAKHYQEDIASGFTDKEDEMPNETSEGISIADDEAWMEDEIDHTKVEIPTMAPEVGSKDSPVIVADLDGTLMGDPNSKYRKQFLPDFIARIRELRDSHGLVFVLNSGATYDRIIQTLESQPDPIWPDHLLLRESEIYHLAEPGKYVEHMPYNDQSRKLRSDSIQAIRQFIPQWSEEWHKTVQIVKWQVQKYEVVVMLPDSDQAMVLRDIIRKQLRMVRDVSVMSNRRVVAITSNLFNKKVVLEELLRHRSWDPRQVIALGDDVNDLPILDGRLALAACPSNAVDSVKESVQAAGGYIAEGSYGEGALEAIEWFMQEFESRIAQG